MANLYLYFVFVLAFLAIGGASDDSYADEQDPKIIYLDINAIDSDDDSNDLNSILLSLPVFTLPSRDANSNNFYCFSEKTFSSHSSCIRAPPAFI